MRSNKLRFFVEKPLGSGEKLRLPENASHKIRSVLRLRKKDEIVVFNHQHLEFKATIKEIDKRHVTVLTTEEIKNIVESPLQIKLIIAIIKAEKMDYALQKATELGVTSILPFFAARSVIRINDERKEKRFIHWNNIIRSAAEQCVRRTIPALCPFGSLNEIVALTKNFEFLILDPHAKDKMSGISRSQKPIAIVCGPEGGLTEEESHNLINRGGKNVNIGPRVLRAETASTCALTIAQSLWGDI